jgi:hypothetical protein
MAPTDFSASSASSILDKIEIKWFSHHNKFIYYYHYNLTNINDHYNLTNIDDESIIDVDGDGAIVLDISPER